MRKTDQELMWEVFMEASNSGIISTGGPLKAGGGSSAPKSEDAEDVDGDPYEDEEGKFGEYLEGDNISDEIKQSMVDKFGKWVSFHISQSQYAPERKRPIMTLLSKKAFERRQLQTA